MSHPLSGKVNAATEQEVASRLGEFHKLRARGALCTELCEQLATEASHAFLSHYRTQGKYLRDAITLLSEISTLEEPRLRSRASGLPSRCWWSSSVILSIRNNVCCMTGSLPR